MIVWLPVALGVYVTEQVEVFVEATASVHVEPEPNAPDPLDESVTEPVGEVLVVLSVTVAVHVVVALSPTGDGVQATVVAVVSVNDTVVEPWLEYQPGAGVTAPE